MAKEFTYRGKTLAELEKLDIKELSSLLPARARRLIKRGFTDQQKRLLKRIDAAKSGARKKAIKTHARDMIILPKMIGLTILIHQGKEFQPIIIAPEMIGHYLGEFAFTRKKVEHSAPGVGATKSSAAISARS